MGRSITFAVLAWLSLVLAGREHALQALGLELACVHPAAPATAAHAAVHTDGGDDPSGPHARRERLEVTDHHDQAAEPDADDGDDCPPGCTGCACGAAPCVTTSPPVLLVRPTWHLDAFERDPSRTGPARAPRALERPPRAA